jgi:predicted O-linked N-acetylglucosamine transferase (SPINDLY family)
VTPTRAVGEPPAHWPARCAGALRIGVLVSPSSHRRGPAIGEIVDAWASPEPKPCTLWLLVPAPRLEDAIAAAIRAAGIGAIAFGGVPTAQAVRAIADVDLDAIVVFSERAGSIGELLDARPARRAIAVRHDASGEGRFLGAMGNGGGVDSSGKGRFIDAIAAAVREIEGAGPRPECPLDPRTLRSLWQQALVAHQQGRLSDARTLYERVVAAQPEAPQVRLFLGRLLASQGEQQRARSELRLAFDLAPQWAGARTALADTLLDCASALRQSGDLEAAERALAEATEVDPGSHAALFNLAMTRVALGRPGEAVPPFERAVGLAPRDPLGHKGLCEALQAQGRTRDWIEAFHRFESACPDLLSMAVHALEACQWDARQDRVAWYLDGLAKGRFRAADITDEIDCLEQLLYLLLFFDVAPAEHLRRYRDYDRLLRAAHPGRVAVAAERRPGRLRVGYVSADLRNHVMGKMMWEPISRHDRAEFEVFCYSLGTVEDAWTRRFVAGTEHFVRLSGRSDEDAVARIAADDIDLLVDLGTHTRGARPAIFAAKPARVALTHVASAGALGLGTVDFKLTDRYADPPSNQAFLLEELLPMDGCVYPYRHVVASEAAESPRRALGVPDDTVVIGAFVALLKLSPRCLDLWREVLAAIPRAVLAFSPNRAADAGFYSRLVERAGIASDRLVFVPQAPDDEGNQARYLAVDFVLDPVPFGGVNGTLEALAMRVPVVTLVGKRHQERTGYSMLANLGVEELAVRSPAEYVALAVRLAGDRDFARSVRARIAAGLESSVLTDAGRYTRNLETAYRHALESRGIRVRR